MRAIIGSGLGPRGLAPASELLAAGPLAQILYMVKSGGDVLMLNLRGHANYDDFRK